MKANELMIGDWVYNKHHGKNIRLTPYDFFTHTHNEFGEQELAPFAKPTIGRDLEPIPLTPEILEKNGFILLNCNTIPFIKDNWWVYRDFQFPENMNDSIGRKGFKYEYVHQLQHALRLCGINHEIIL